MKASHVLGGALFGSSAAKSRIESLLLQPRSDAKFEEMPEGMFSTDWDATWDDSNVRTVQASRAMKADDREHWDAFLSNRPSDKTPMLCGMEMLSRVFISAGDTMPWNVEWSAVVTISKLFGTVSFIALPQLSPPVDHGRVNTRTTVLAQVLQNSLCVPSKTEQSQLARMNQGFVTLHKLETTPERISFSPSHFGYGVLHRELVKHGTRACERRRLATEAVCDRLAEAAFSRDDTKRMVAFLGQMQNAPAEFLTVEAPQRASFLLEHFARREARAQRETNPL
tara:strand:- start:3086 stop:3931 length:846 start_codon:yes stop_codon:yes gene_type:complete